MISKILFTIIQIIIEYKYLIAVLPIFIVLYTNNRLSLKSAPILVKGLALLSFIMLLYLGIFWTYSYSRKTILTYDYDIDDTFGILSVSNVLPLIACVQRPFSKVEI